MAGTDADSGGCGGGADGAAPAAGNTLDLQATGEGKVKAALTILLGSGETPVEVEAVEGRALAERPDVYAVRFVLPEGIPASAAIGLVLLADGERAPAVRFAMR